MPQLEVLGKGFPEDFLSLSLEYLIQTEHSSEMKQVVEFCSGCVVRSFHSDQMANTTETKSKFMTDLREALQQAEPQVEWDISFTSCMRYCPEEKISTVWGRRMVMSPGSEISEVVQFLTSQLNRSKS